MTEVIAEISGKAGIITLNRPKALNALNQNMVELLDQALRDFAVNDDVALVILRGAGERGLCAGGDIVALYNDAKENGVAGAKFWHDEYQLNHYISEYPKPYVAIMDGIVLGGGIGVSAHGSHRIVTDSTRMGMPEAGIGFVPDVGGSYLLSHAPHNLGVHLALTGVHIGAAEAIAADLADFYVAAGNIEPLLEKLCATGEVAVIEDFASTPSVAFADAIEEIAELYQADSVEEILNRLTDNPASWAQEAATKIQRNSPLALKATFESIQRARGKSLAEALETEYLVSNNMHSSADFCEGVRAQVIDKDRNPQWSPATLTEVTKEHVESIFAPLTDPRITPLKLVEKEKY